MERLLLDLLSPLTLRERHFRLSVKIPRENSTKVVLERSKAKDVPLTSFSLGFFGV